mgnify:CR=1 FL=1
MEQSISKKATFEKSYFFATLYLSTFTFGGGYVIVSLMKTKFVDELHWIDETEMLDLIAIAQSSPGAVAVNGAIVVGYKLCRIPGVFFCNSRRNLSHHFSLSQSFLDFTLYFRKMRLFKLS